MPTPRHPRAHLLAPFPFPPSRAPAPMTSSPAFPLRIPSLLLPALSALLLLAAPALAQAQDGDPPPRGPSLVLGLSSGPEIGFWLPAGERLRVGIESNLGWQRVSPTGDSEDDDVRSLTSLTLRVPLRHALESGHPDILPYLLAGPSLSLVRSDTHPESTGFGAFAGLGVEWFPVERVSVGGYAALEAVRVRRDATGPFPAGTETLVQVRTWSSVLRMQFYL